MRIANTPDVIKEAIAPIIGALTDKSGSITNAATSQLLAAKKENRAYFLFQNISDAAMWINFGAAATADNNSILINAQGSLLFNGSFIPEDAVYVLCASSGKKFVCKEG